VLHSSLSDGERYDEWRKIKRNEVNIVIGEEYSYHVYEQTNPSNLDPANATGIVENGILRYELLENDREEYTNTNTTRAVYRK
jgi:hypothetical protein